MPQLPFRNPPQGAQEGTPKCGPIYHASYTSRNNLKKTSSHFRALKTKHETPKYGLIYHASLIGQAPAKYKGKISRVLAAKCALGVRVDALGDVNDNGAVGLESRAKVRRG